MTAHELASTDAPDFAEPLSAWRVWRVVATRDGYSLGSVIKPTVWTPGEPLTAECLRHSPLPSWFRRKRGRAHAVPDAACECGIYAGWLPVIRQYLHDPPAYRAVARVLGQVSLWGRVIECERGFRGSRAYPLRLYVPVDCSLDPRHRLKELAAGLERYGVPVEHLPVRFAEAVEALEQPLDSRFTRRHPGNK